jgi:hypothetical protein
MESVRIAMGETCNEAGIGLFLVVDIIANNYNDFLLKIGKSLLALSFSFSWPCGRYTSFVLVLHKKKMNHQHYNIKNTIVFAYDISSSRISQSR